MLIHALLLLFIHIQLRNTRIGTYFGIHTVLPEPSLLTHTHSSGIDEG